MTKNLTTENGKFVYREGYITLTWPVSRTGAGKVKVTGIDKGIAKHFKSVIDAYVWGWTNDRNSGVNEFCVYANKHTIEGAVELLK